MIRTFCDKCGKDVTDELIYNVVIQSVGAPYTDLIIRKDICNKCKIELLNMLDKG